MKYRKKPIVIDAIQWNGKFEDLFAAFGTNNLPIGLFPLPALTIKTPEGEMRCNLHDYIIRGIEGEFYPCKTKIFEATYEKVNDESDNQ